MLAAPLILLTLLLAGCATSDKGRTQLVAPDDVGAIYSEFDLRARLVLANDDDCVGDACQAAADFRQQVGKAGARLSRAAYDLYPTLESRISRFEFSVPTKNEVGTLSNAKGNVVVYRGLSELGMDEAALSFVIAREMGHVIGRHHQENTDRGFGRCAISLPNGEHHSWRSGSPPAHVHGNHRNEFRRISAWLAGTSVGVSPGPDR
jgi:hypothetical protein